MKLRLFRSSEGGCDWDLIETIDGGKHLPSEVITYNGKTYWWNSSLNERYDYIPGGFCYCEVSSPITAY